MHDEYTKANCLLVSCCLLSLQLAWTKQKRQRSPTEWARRPNQEQWEITHAKPLNHRGRNYIFTTLSVKSTRVNFHPTLTPPVTRTKTISARPHRMHVWRWSMFAHIYLSHLIETVHFTPHRTDALKGRTQLSPYDLEGNDHHTAETSELGSRKRHYIVRLQTNTAPRRAADGKRRHTSVVRFKATHCTPQSGRSQSVAFKVDHTFSYASRYAYDLLCFCSSLRTIENKVSHARACPYIRRQRYKSCKSLTIFNDSTGSSDVKITEERLNNLEFPSRTRSTATTYRRVLGWKRSFLDAHAHLARRRGCHLQHDLTHTWKQQARHAARLPSLRRVWKRALIAVLFWGEDVILKCRGLQ